MQWHGEFALRCASCVKESGSTKSEVPAQERPSQAGRRYRRSGASWRPRLRIVRDCPLRQRGFQANRAARPNRGGNGTFPPGSRRRCRRGRIRMPSPIGASCLANSAGRMILASWRLSRRLKAASASASGRRALTILRMSIRPDAIMRITCWKGPPAWPREPAYCQSHALVGDDGARLDWLRPCRYQ